MTIPEVDKKTEKEIINLVEKVIEGRRKGLIQESWKRRLIKLFMDYTI